MHEELENFERNQVWELVEPPPNCHPIGTKWVWRRFALIDPLRRCFTYLDSVLLDLYPACAEELYSDVVIILCISPFIPVLYGFVPLETWIAHDSRFLGLSRRCRESSFHLRKFSSFQL
jgi:hypothetical protein